MAQRDLWDDPGDFVLAGSKIKVTRPPFDLCRLFLRGKLKHSATLRNTLDKLVKWGCQAEDLITHWALIMEGKSKDEWSYLLKFKPRQVKSLIVRLQACAEDCERLGSSFVARSLMTRFPSTIDERALGAALRSTSRKWEFVLKALRRNHSMNSSASRMGLLEYVTQKTGQPHYRQVSELISAAENHDIDTVALRVWHSTRKKKPGVIPANRKS